jgi:Legume lectin domain
MKIPCHSRKLVLTTAALAALLGLSMPGISQTVGYFASPSTPPGPNISGENLGHTFTVSGTNITVYSLGVFSYGGGGLNHSHTVILFTNQTPLASVTVPAGTSAPLLNYFRFAALPTPIVLAPGSYAVVAYQMNGSGNGSDSYGRIHNPNYNGFNGSFVVQDTIGPGETILEITTNGSAYPGTGGGTSSSPSSDYASASFTYVDSSTTTIAYTADPVSAQYGEAANTEIGLNIGHNFTVTGAGIEVYQLGVFNYGGLGLNAPHNVTLFSEVGLNNYVPVPGGTVMVPSGTAAPLGNGFRFAPLAAPVMLPAGSYTIVAYQMNGTNYFDSDPYAEGNVSGFIGGGNVADTGISPYEFTSSDSPAYPTGSSAAENFGCVSFTYSNIIVTAPVITGQPGSNVLAYAGSSPQFSVMATGTPTNLSYQWYFDGNLVPTATNSTFALSDVQLAVSGETFSCEVSNSGGSTNTVTSVLTVTPVLGFEGLGTGWQLNGSSGAGFASNALELTQGGTNEHRSSFFNLPVYIGAFQAAFTYTDFTGSQGADGFCFVVQNDPRAAAAIGGIGSYLGYGPASSGISNSVALEFNIYAANPTSQVGLGFGENGFISDAATTFPVDISSGDPINVTVTSQGGVISVQLEDTNATATFSTNFNVDIPTAIGTNTAYVGFTGADGGASSIQQIANFQFVTFANLSIQLSGANIVVAWPANSSAYQLESNPDLSNNSGWANVTNSVSVTNGLNQVTLPVSAGATFFRLQLP